MELTMRESPETITASKFKATCLELLDRLAQRKIMRLVITKRGKPVAVLTPADTEADAAALFGCMKGSVRAPASVDFTAPVLEETLSAEKGRIHG